MTSVSNEISSEPTSSRLGRMSGDPDSERDVDWTDLGAAMWSYLTGRGAAINYTFEDMAVEVPRDTGHDAPRATWVLNGNLRITTSDDATPGPDATV
jgi:hypothetical protein